MDKEQAKFILQSFRPNGQDAADADFQEALQLAVEDREIGEWLAAERAMDADFSAALGEIAISENLRVNILAIMHGAAPEDPESDDEMDQLLSDALTDMHPPEGLRDQILAAMEMQKKSTSQKQDVGVSNIVVGKFNQKKWINVAAIAAAVVLGVFLALQMDFGDKQKASLTSYDVQQNAGQLLNAGFSLDVKNSDSTHLTSWLSDQNLPAPSELKDLPPGLRDLPSVGCKKMVLPGDKEGSLICFLTKDKNSIHLVVVSNDTVEDANLPERSEVTVSNCYHCPKTSWNVVRWRDVDNTYILLAKPEAQEKEELLKYF